MMHCFATSNAVLQRGKMGLTYCKQAALEGLVSRVVFNWDKQCLKQFRRT
jgi:hypothetical protein